MNRQQRRASERKSQKNRTATYNMTKSQLDSAVKFAAQKELSEEYNRGVENGVNQALVLLFTLPLEVLMDHYWEKTYDKKIPEFTNYVLEYYEKWQNGEIDMEKLKEDLWQYGGVRLEVQNGED